MNTTERTNIDLLTRLSGLVVWGFSWMRFIVLILWPGRCIVTGVLSGKPFVSVKALADLIAKGIQVTLEYLVIVLPEPGSEELYLFALFNVPVYVHLQPDMIVALMWR